MCAPGPSRLMLGRYPKKAIMKTNLLTFISLFAFALLSSCGDREDTSPSEGSTSRPEMKRMVTVLQSDG